MGPPPNPNARRRNNRTAGFVTLPERCDRPVPACPIPGEHAASVWRTWWQSPMATQWAEADQPFVALTLSLLLKADQSTAATAEARQWTDRFGLTPLGRLRNRWLLPDGAETGAESPVVRLLPGGRD